MGFGFVNFETNQAAQAAIVGLNGTKLREDKIMKVSVARPAWKANIHSNLYIAGFSPAYTEPQIMDLLGVHASSAENVRLLRDSNKNPRGAAVVRMSSEEAATGVISAMNGVPCKDGASLIQVRAWRPEFRFDRISDENIACTFPPFANMSKYSQPPMVQQILYPDAQQLLHQMSSLHKQSLLPSPTTTPVNVNTDDEEENLATLFVFHLPGNMSEEYLKELFSQNGEGIESVQVMRNKGYGFISYFRSADAVSALKRLNGITLEGSSKPIRIELKE